MGNLPEIKEIHIPDGVSPFPLAYGWWIVLLGAVLTILLIRLIFWLIKTSKKYYALRTLETIDITEPVTAAILISELLKRICIFKYKEANVLYGQEWLNFLNLHAKDKLSDTAARLLEYAPYMNKKDSTYTSTDAETIKKFARNWIGVNL